MKLTFPFLLAAALLAGCATSSSLGTAADRLDKSAHRFYREVSYDRGYARTGEAAALFAEATRDFNRAVDRSNSEEALRPSFERVSGRYHQLRQRVESGSPPYGNAEPAFERVTDAYLDVDRALNHPRGY